MRAKLGVPMAGLVQAQFCGASASQPLYRMRKGSRQFRQVLLAAQGSQADSAPALGDPASAEASTLRFNGFGTVGLTHANLPDGWGFRRDVSHPGSIDHSTSAAVDSRLGLQLNYAPTRWLEFVGQAVLRQRSDQSSLAALEWAFVALRPTPDWTLRLGRINLDAFLLSDYRNVGFAYPWVRPEIGFYGTIPLYSITGGDLTRTWADGSTYWKAKLFAGNGSITVKQYQTDQASKTDLKPVLGLTLSRESGGLTLRAAAVRVYGQLQDPNVRQLDAALAGVEQIPVPQVQAEAAALRS